MPALKTYASKADILKGLNPEQKKAVNHDKGPMLVIAGAGTGKTTVIIRRIANLIASKKAKPGEILALTFTDKAADEMEQRVDKLVPYGYIDVSISTFHAFGDRVLRDHAIDLGLRPDYRVLSRAEQTVFFREHLFEFPLKHYKSLSDPTRHIQSLISAISRAQDEDISPEELIKYAKKRTKEELELAKIYKKYQALKAKKGFIDFGDQVSLALKVFREQPAVLKKFQQKYKYILVDEFQDTNYAQFELLKLLAGKLANLTVVGDDDQSIYKFRGAAISNILGFKKVYKKARNVVLTRNYRSSQLILDTAHRLIKFNDPDRLEVKSGINKKLKSCLEPANKLRGSKKSRNRDVQSQVPSRPVHKNFDKVSSEADWVAQTVKKKFEQGYKYNDFAVLVRSNADAEIFRQTLNMNNIPHQFSGGGGLYLNPEIQLAISFLKSIGDLADSVALFQLSSSPIYQLDPLDLQKINTFANRRNYTLHHVFTHIDSADEEYQVLDDIKADSRATIKKIMQDLKYYLNFARTRSTGEVLYKFLKRSGYLAKLTREDSTENEHRMTNLARFFDRVRAFAEIAEIDRVPEFVKHLNILREAGENPETVNHDPDLDAVNVLTVHKAKGLEFKVVFMVSLVAEKFPVRRRREAIELPAKLIKEDVPEGDFHLQEERRLFYVGMTRAKEELYLSSALDYGGKRQRKVSQFVLEALDMPRVDIGLIKSSAKDQIELFAPAELVLPAAKKYKTDEPVYLTAYKVDDYLTCPLKYKYIHILRVPLLPNHQIIYGSAMHKAAQAYSQAKLNKQKFTEKNLLAVLKNAWSSEGFISREHEEQRLATAKKALKRFLKEQKKSITKIKYVEESFSIPKENIIVRGRWDRVDQEKGKAIIIDYKTSEVKDQKDADKKAGNNDQLTLYALAWAEKFKELPERVELYFIESGLIGSTRRDAKAIAKFWDKVLKVAQGIRKARFAATPNQRACSYCPYSEICPASAV